MEKAIKIHSRIQIFIEIISLLFILLFVYASFSKLMDFPNFKLQLGKSPVTTSFSGLFSLMIPSLEILISCLLVYSALRLFALYAAFGMMTLFSIYIFAILHYSPYIPCSCGGVLQKMSWNQHLLFNILFTILAALAILLYPKQWKGIH
jgi:uncharacterized membrane protein YphA (DoxX/SURF4 family)